MSTFTSAQLHVKRSSTRLHAPPGGVSSLSFGCGGFGTAEPAEELPSKEEPVYSRPSSSSRYTSSSTSCSNSNNATSGYPGYSASQVDPTPFNNYAPPKQAYQHQQYQQQPSYNPSGYNNPNYGNNNFSTPSYANNNNGLQMGSRPPSSTPSSRSSCRSSSSSRSWSSQPPLTSSKRDQNWEKKRRLWLGRQSGGGSSYTGGSNSSMGYGATSTSTWSPGPAGMLDDVTSPASPLSKLMHQHAQQQPPPSPAAEYQRLDTASSMRSSSSYAQQPAPYQAPAGYSASPYSRGGPSTASSTTSSSRRQPPEATASGRWHEADT